MLIHLDIFTMTGNVQQIKTFLSITKYVYFRVEYVSNLCYRCDMYLHVVDEPSQTIAHIPDVLKVIDAKYDYLKDYYAGFSIQKVVVSKYLIRNMPLIYFII